MALSMFALRSPTMRFFQALPTFIVVTAHATAPGPASAQPPTRLHTPGQGVNPLIASRVGCVVIFPAVAGEILHCFTGRRGEELARRRPQEA
jgi:hypothetical protein